MECVIDRVPTVVGKSGMETSCVRVYVLVVWKDSLWDMPWLSLLGVIASGSICDRIWENLTLPGFIDFVLEPIIVTQQHFGENAVITATGQQTHGLQDIGV